MNARMYFIARQRGLSLVESLVGMVLILALIAGVSQVLLSTQFNTRSQNDRASMDDAARFAIEYLSRAGQRAGFKRNSDDNDGEVFLAVSGGFPKGASVFGTDTTLNLRYQGHADRQLANCHNLAADSQAQLYTETWALNGSNQLTCTVTAPDGTAGTPQALMDNVEAINFQYGVDTDNDRYPDVYSNASAVGNWANVTSVRVGLRMVSTGNNLTETPQPFIDFNGNPATPPDRRLRRNVFTTVALRNRLP